MTILHPIHTDSKRLPSKIRYARPVACQGASRAAGRVPRIDDDPRRIFSGTYKALTCQLRHSYNRRSFL